MRSIETDLKSYSFFEFIEKNNTTNNNEKIYALTISTDYIFFPDFTFSTSEKKYNC